MDEETQRTWAERTVRAMSQTFVEIKDKPLQEQDRYFPHAQRCYDWIVQWSLRFWEAAHFLLLLGGYAQKRFFYSQAEECFLQAIEIIEAIRAKGHVERAVVYNNTAAFYEEMEKYELAETYLRKALLIFEASSVPGRNLFLARTLSNLAAIVEKRNNLIEAEHYARRAVEILEQEENIDNSAMRYALHTYEVILFRLKKNEEARQVADRINGLFHPEQASDLERARMLESQGEKESPMRIDLIEQALELFRREYGAEQREIAHCLSALGAGYMERGEYIRAQFYYQQALEMYKSIKSAEHSDVVIILAHLVTCSLSLGQWKEAGAFFEQAQKLAEKNPSPYVSRQMMEMLKQVLRAFPQEEES